MKFAIIIPAHNEENFIGKTLESLCKQTHLPSEIIVVNDNSTDGTVKIITSYRDQFDFIKVINSTSTDLHLPGSKIINAFYKGYKSISKPFDIICKFDADLIFPSNYLEQLAFHFKNEEKVGMAAGFCEIETQNGWKLEDFTSKDHIRGALKAYRKACFEEIGGLRRSMGWDTLDELLARYYGWEIVTDPNLRVKHLKPTGENYAKQATGIHGEALYKLRYGWPLTIITGLKMGVKRKSFSVFKQYISGYHNSKLKKLEFLVDEHQGKYIRNLRWKGILKKLNLS
ncbi:glycosyltransferase [Aegicerativicinus sediminis]|uniref:glycosyltransferase n=1 Tax=Aegicerativicinus sediminis TaxID=2893202 RepID=UPI001E2A4C38|nr:glycosyltransferase family A protein [Aegicerativicinus sediminis]